MSRIAYDPRRPLDGLTRRGFLAASGVIGAAAALAGCSAVAEDDVRRAAQATPLAGGTPIVVLVTLYGGNDSLNTLIPYADPAYRAHRPELAWGEGEVLRLDDSFGLNPGLKGLHRAWSERRLAIVRGVGYPRPDRSHFRSMDIWQTASPEAPVRTGWVGRWLDGTGADPLTALHIGSVLPPLAVGENRVAAALSGSAKGGAAGAAASTAMRELAKPDPADGPAARAVVASYAAAERVRAQLAAPGGKPGAGPTSGPATPPSSSPSQGEGEDGNGGMQAGEANSGGALGRQLEVVSRCIRAGAPTRLYRPASAVSTPTPGRRRPTVRSWPTSTRPWRGCRRRSPGIPAPGT